MTPGPGWICGHLWMLRRGQGTRDCPIHSCERPDPHDGWHRCSCGAVKDDEENETALIDSLQEEAGHDA